MNRPYVGRNTTTPKLSFFRFTEPHRIDVAADGESGLVGFEYVRQLGEPAGQINFTLKGYRGRDPWPELVQEGDWWGLDIVKNGVEQGLSFGRLDRVGVSVSGAEGRVSVSVSGRDFGCALMDTPVFFSPHDPVLDNALGIQMMTIIDRAAGTAGEVAVATIRGFMGGEGAQPFAGHFMIPPGLVSRRPTAVRWVDGINFTRAVQPGLRGELLTQPMFMPSGSPALWQYVDTWRNPVLNEMYLECSPLPGYPKAGYLVVREKPFENPVDGRKSPWFRLRTWNVDASTIKTMSVGRGANRKNYISLSGEMLTGLSEESMVSTFLSHADLADVQRHGLRRLEEYTRYMDDAKNIGAQIEHREWLSLITAWNVLNHRYWQGTIALGEMRAEIRPGDRIRIINGPPGGYDGFPADGGNPDKALTFYVEGVRHAFREGPRPTAETVIGVSRGFIDGERIPEITAAVERFAPIVSTAGSANDPRVLNTTTAQEDATVASSDADLRRS